MCTQHSYPLRHHHLSVFLPGTEPSILRVHSHKYAHLLFCFSMHSFTHTHTHYSHIHSFACHSTKPAPGRHPDLYSQSHVASHSVASTPKALLTQRLHLPSSASIQQRLGAYQSLPAEHLWEDGIGIHGADYIHRTPNIHLSGVLEGTDGGSICWGTGAW